MFSLKPRPLIFLVSLAIIFILSIAIVNYMNIRDILEDSYLERINLLEEGIFSALQRADTATRIIESQLNSRMEYYTDIMLEKYQENPEVLTWDLERLQREFDGYEIYIIDQDLVVIHTTYQEDLGLDFKKFPRFAEILRDRLKGDAFSTDRLDISINTSETRKFSYMPTPDNRYLLELGVSMKDYFPYLKGMELNEVIKVQVKKYESVDDITIYRITKEGRPSLSVSQIDPESLRGQVIKENEEVAMAAILANSPSELLQDSETGHILYRYIPYLSFTQEGDLDYWNSYLIEIVFNDKGLVASLGEQRNRFFSGISLTLLVVGFLLLGIFLLFQKTEEGKKKMERVINQTSEGYYMLDGAHRITEVNGSFCQLIGYPRDFILGKKPSFFMDEKNQEIFAQESKKCSQKTHHSFEVIFFDSYQRQVHTRINSTSIKGHKEQSGYYFAFISDISSQKEEKEELKKTRDAAQAASQFKSEFLATMSHEIRTPMNGIVAMTEVLLETGLDVDQKKYMSIIWESSGILMNIINDILDFSKIEAGKMSFKPVHFSLKEMLTGVTELYLPKAKKKGLDFILESNPFIPDYLHGDHLRIRQVLGNLINNAIQFTDEGSIQIKVKDKGRGGEVIHLMFQVQDTGVGIGEGKKEALFQPFTQLDSSTTRKYGGTGLGLAICKRLVELMGGHMDYRSELGEGSVFFFTIPLGISTHQKEEMISVEKEDSSLQGSVLSEPILVAEDNKVNQQIAMIQLKKLGFLNIKIVENGQEALEAALKKKYSLILMDCQMPIMDGYTASMHIRKEEKIYTPIVAMTAHSMEGDRQKCLSMGMDDYISKPVKLEVLRQVLQKILKTHSLADRKKDQEQTALSEAIQLDVLEGVSGVSREELYLLEDVFQLYLENTQKKMEELEEALNEKDASTIQSLAHFLKSSSGNLGAVRFSSLAQEVEKKAKEGDVSGLEVIFSQMEREVASVFEAIEGFLSKTS